MAFLVEDGTIVDGATSLASVAEADAYWSDRGNTAWAALTTQQKQVNLVKGTDYFSQVWGLQLSGELIELDQPQPYPRTGAVVLGTELEEDEVPLRAIQAVIELADRARAGTLLPDVEAGVGELVSETKTVGPLTKSNTYAQGTARVRPTFPAVNQIVKPLLRSTSGGVIR